jgi:hypothetical protein
VGALDADNPYFGGATVMPFSDKQEDPFASRPDPSPENRRVFVYS